MSTDLLLCIGADISKNPIAIVPSMATMNKSKIIIIKESKCPDDIASIKIYGDFDSVFKMLMAKLLIENPTSF